jgi:2'-hydroxyisoflavone reductase
MRLLVMGGTRFVGHAIVTEAVRLGWHVSTFSRGVSGDAVPGAQALRGDRTSASDLAALAATGPWDAVVDTSGYVPRETLAVCRQLQALTARYLFMSTVSVYRGWPTKPLSDASEVLYCPPDAGPDYGQDVEDGPTRYGYQKAGCERAVTTAFGPSRSTILRPGVVLGPREYVGRLPWWLRRIAYGGRVLAPGAPARPIQPLDVRDLASFAIRAITEGISGAYAMAAPIGLETFGGMLETCRLVTRSDAELVWVDDDLLIAQGVRQWSEMPLWRIFPGVWHVDASAAAAHGLTCRPLADTVADTWSWLQQAAQTADDPRAAEIGISPDREQRILARVA